MDFVRKLVFEQFLDFNDFGFESQQSSLENLVERLCTKGEGNSVLVIGPNCSSKEKIVSNVLEDVDKSSTAVVRLNGLLQTDDRTALKEVGRQLKLRFDMEQQNMSYSDCLNYLLDSLKETAHKALIFSLEEFDLFATHHNQSLLYNLLDATQGVHSVPVLVIGLTSRLDVTELLEKRVRSRLSSLKLFFFSTLSFDDYHACALGILSIDISLSQTIRPTQMKEVNRWNDNIKILMECDEIKRILRKQYDVEKSSEGLLHVLEMVLHLSNDELPQVNHFVLASQLRTPDSLEISLKSLSLLELCILIACRRLCQRFENEPFNFEMVYQEFRKFVNSNRVKLFQFEEQTQQNERSGRKFDKIVVSKAYERVISLELIVPLSETGSKHQQSSFRPCHLQLDPTVFSTFIKNATLPTAVSAWAQSKLN